MYSTAPAGRANFYFIFVPILFRRRRRRRRRRKISKGNDEGFKITKAKRKEKIRTR